MPQTSTLNPFAMFRDNPLKSAFRNQCLHARYSAATTPSKSAKSTIGNLVFILLATVADNYPPPAHN